MMKLTEELKERARAAKSADELMSLAKEAGEEWTAEEAKNLYARLHREPGEMPDEELSAVAGGGCGGGMERMPCDYQVGDRIRLRGYATCGDSWEFMGVGGNRGCMARSWRVTGISETVYQGHPSYSLEYVCDSCNRKGWIWIGSVERM